jgi:hypothetical protein
VITTVNKRVMEQKIGRTNAIELIGGHADDFEPLMEVVRRSVTDACGPSWSVRENTNRRSARSAKGPLRRSGPSRTGPARTRSIRTTLPRGRADP